MNAEVRYAFYLRLLSDTNHKDLASREEFPLPPWDVALIFYTHLLSPYRYQRDISVEYPSLWNARIKFPLTRLSKLDRCTWNDAASQLEWEKRFPNVPYQILEFADGEDPRLIPGRALDIRAYNCSSPECLSDSTREPCTIKAQEWAWFRMGKSRATPACPRCRRVFSASMRPISSEFACFCRAVFGAPVFGLWDAPLRQFGQGGFVERILALSGTSLRLPLAQARYGRFLQLIKTHEWTTFVPTLDIDLVWHTHQLSPFAYEAYCRAHVGRAVNHDDTIGAWARGDALVATKRDWALAFGESYLDPDDTASPNAARLAEHQKTHAARLAAMKARLAEYDVAHAPVRQRLDEAYEAERVAQEAVYAAGAELGAATAAMGAKWQELYRPGRGTGPWYVPLTLRRLWARFGWARWGWSEAAGARRAELNVLLLRERERRAEQEVRVDAKQKASQARIPLQVEWDRVYLDRVELQRQLQTEVDAAAGAVWRCVAETDRLRGDPLGRGAFAVVPSEAQIQPPPVCGDVPIRAAAAPGWGLGYNNQPSHYTSQGGGSFGGGAFGPDYLGNYAARGGAGWGETSGGAGYGGWGGGGFGGDGGGGGGGCGGGEGGGGGCGGGGCGGGGCGGGCG